MTDRPILFSAPMVRALLDGRKTQTRRALKATQSEAINRGFDKSAILLRYAVGDRLWCRETWAPHASGIDYRADFHDASASQAGSWRPSIFMPRHASRLTLIVTDVRAQRLQDISEADAVTEGVNRWGDATWEDYHSNGVTHVTLNPRDSFRTLWNSINGLGAWDANPWVVALTFTVHRCNIDAMEKAA